MFVFYFSGSSGYCHRRGSQGDLFEASEKIVEEEEEEDYDDDAFEKSFSKAFEPPGAPRSKGIVDMLLLPSLLLWFLTNIHK